MHKLKSKNITLETNNRLYQCSTPLIGLTGGIATGKSTVSSFLKDQGFGIIDADVLVKKIYQSDEAIKFIADIDSQCVVDNRINFKALRELFFSQKEIQSSVEKFIYERLPLVFKEELKIQITNCDADFIFYDVPLLFEKSLDQHLDRSILVYSPAETQIKRVMKRDQITEDLAKTILQKQLPIDDKRQKAQFIIENTSTLDDLHKQIRVLTKELCQ